ncbi:MAG: ribonuclease HI family protein [Patescibacteria group bacterium]
MTKYVIHTDGASRGNPGEAAIAYVINQDKNLTEYCQRTGITTNNIAEYQAMAASLDKLIEMGVEQSQLDFFSDSELMVKQLLGEYRVKDAKLRPIYDAIQSKLTKLRGDGNSYTLNAIRRQYNKRADELANYALDNHQA